MNEYKMYVPWKAACDGIGLEEWGNGVADTDSNELLVGIDFVLVTASKCFGNGNAFEKSN